MIQTLRILMVDDHPLIIEGYKNVLLEHFKDVEEVIIDTAFSCDEALNTIDALPKKAFYSLALIDVELPAATTRKGVTSGEGVASYLQRKCPDTSVLILTMHSEPDRIQSILEEVNPDAFLIKSDISASELGYACNQVLEGKSYYSATVNTLLRNMVVNKIVLDNFNRQILYHLSEGVFTKDLVDYINLSLSAIEKRKNYMKELLGVQAANDRLLVAEAKKRGLI